MPTPHSTLSKTISAVRIATSVFFLLFGEYKLAGPGFAHGGFQTYLQGYISTGAVSLYRPLLSGMVLPHAVFFGYVVGVVETFIGLSLLLGLWVRPACVLGILYLLNLNPGHVVGTGSQRARLAQIRRRTRSFALVAVIDHLLCCRRRPHLGPRRPGKAVIPRAELAIQISIS
jgi:uncharacterized membrane protein YphA (DoxX/SURF4 family)